MLKRLNIFLLLFLSMVLMSCSDGEGVDDLFGINDQPPASDSGDVGNSAFSFTPNTFDFGAVLSSSSFSDTTITATNTSDENVSVTSVGGANSHFLIQATTCNGLKEPNESCTITVRFQPQSIGNFGATVQLNYESSRNTGLVSQMGVEGLGVGNLVFSGIDSIDDLQTRSVRINWTHDPSAANYFVFEIVGGIPNLIQTVAAPTATYTVSGLTPNTTYEYRVRAQDFFGSLENNTNDVSTTTLQVPNLTSLADLTFAAGAEHVLGSAIALDVDNTVTGNDTNITYTCTYDTVIDDNVAAGADCSTLPGTVNTTNLAADGQLTWSIPALGNYELRFEGNMQGDTGEEIVAIQVRSNYDQTNLLMDFNALFAQRDRVGANIPFDTSFLNLTDAGALVGVNASLNNFAGTTASGWNGDGSLLTPYSLQFDGTGDNLDLGSGFNANTSLYFQSWFQFTDASTAGQTLFANGGLDQNGLQVSISNTLELEALIGSYIGVDHDFVILASSPIAYFRFDGSATGVGALVNEGSLGAAVDAEIQATMRQYPIATDTVQSYSASFNGSSNYGLVPSNNAINNNGATFNEKTIELFFNANDVNTQQTLYEQGGSTNGFAIYLSGGNVYCQAWSITQGWGDVPNLKFISSPVNVNENYHVALTFDHPNQEFKCYLNGSQILPTVTGFGLMNTHSGDISIGRFGDSTFDFNGAVNPGGSGQYYNGRIDELVLYNSVLSAATIATHANLASLKYCRAPTRIRSHNFFNIGFYTDGSTARLYLDGSEECSFDHSLAAFSPAAANFRVGSDSSQNNEATGELAHLVIHSDAPTGTPATDASNYHTATSGKFVTAPSGIADLDYWFDPTRDLTLEAGNLVSSWLDQSDNNFHAEQSTGAEQPTYVAAALNGVGGLRFADAHYFAIRDLNYSVVGQISGITLAAVIEPTADGHIISFDRSESFRFSIAASAINWMTADSGATIHDLIETTDVVDGNPHLLIVRYDSLTGFKDVYIDGNRVQTDVVAYAPGTNLVGISPSGSLPRFGFIGVGSEATTFDGTIGPLEFFDGDMGDIVQYNRALTPAEIDSLENYFNEKYNLGITP